MNKYFVATTTVLLLAFSTFGFQGISNAEEETAAPSAMQAPAGVQPFTIIISGTRSYSDIDSVRKSIQKIPSMQKFVETVSSQNHVQFVGLFTGDPNSLVASIEGVAADRFEIQSKDDKTRGLVITLRKTSK